ncbi:MAG: hypothetical protein RLO50_17010 [Azospirillaceae bacterium]
MRRIPASVSVIAAAALAATLAIVTAPSFAQKDSGGPGADEPAWLGDWTGLLPDFGEAIRDCVTTARGMPGMAETSVVRRLAPMNHGMGLVALRTPAGEIVECVAELGGGAVDRIAITEDPDWALESTIEVHVVLPPVVDDACGPPTPLYEGSDRVGWRVDRGC